MLEWSFEESQENDPPMDPWTWNSESNMEPIRHQGDFSWGSNSIDIQIPIKKVFEDVWGMILEPEYILTR